MTREIADYALIGDGQTAALVAGDATIEWLCMPRFDSAACFAAMLGNRENGCWRLGPAEDVRTRSRRYRGDSLILETEFTCKNGTLVVTDFMPVRGEAPDIVRIAECTEGHVSVESELYLRFDYGRIHPVVRHTPGDRMLALSGPDAVSLDCDPQIAFDERCFASRFELRKGERSRFVLTWYPSHEDPPARVDAVQALHDTEQFWRTWTSGVDYRGRDRETVMRSLIVLKALIHEPTGGILAAPTASLPERIGGGRNWDYRYCWLRDATFTLLALLRTGLRDEARAWIDWLRRAVGGEPIDLQPFYSVTGAPRAIEWEAPWLAGFGGSRPVRFGNGAQGQLQLDIFGEVIDCLYRAREAGIAGGEDSDQLVRMIAQRLTEVWDRPDAGIWESRGKPRHHTYSKVMCCIAFERAADWFEGTELRLCTRYRDLAATVRKQVLEKGFDRRRGAFVRAYDDDALDAAVLRIPLVGFLPADDPRVMGTVAAVERELCRDGFVHRYSTRDTDDGIDGSEGAFVAATAWLADVYGLQGRRAEARAIFDRVAGAANDLGLLAEEYSANEGRMLGNFPQALSHLSLVTLADRLAGGPGSDRAPGRSAGREGTQPVG